MYCLNLHQFQVIMYLYCTSTKYSCKLFPPRIKQLTSIYLYPCVYKQSHNAQSEASRMHPYKYCNEPFTNHSLPTTALTDLAPDMYGHRSSLCIINAPISPSIDLKACTLLVFTCTVVRDTCHLNHFPNRKLACAAACVPRCVINICMCIYGVGNCYRTYVGESIT